MLCSWTFTVNVIVNLQQPLFVKMSPHSSLGDWEKSSLCQVVSN